MTLNKLQFASAQQFSDLIRANVCNSRLVFRDPALSQRLRLTNVILHRPFSLNKQ